MKLPTAHHNGFWNGGRLSPLPEKLRLHGLPQLFEDEGLEMGESTLHSLSCGVLFYGLKLQFANQKPLQVFTNLNLHYSKSDPTLYVSPDLMVVKSPRQLPPQMTSYRIGRGRPAPCLVAEVLSFRTWQEGDMTSKPSIYAKLGTQEYAVVDVTGTMLPQKLVLLRLQADGTWLDEQDADGGITSRLGFRLIVDSDGQMRVCDAATGKRHPRPDEAGLRLDEMEAALHKERELRQRLEAELTALRKTLSKPKPSDPGGKKH